ncbi:hypothetical protein FBALC1_06483 [Flavobacteriales bacterium ALC-1]|nr:hypothetical protein FBALC1_06483 [Flavobacteriales bacterium ALC-1]
MVASNSIYKAFTLILGLFMTLKLNAQDVKELDSLLNNFNLHSEDTLKVKTGNRLFDIYYWIDPDEGLKLAKSTLKLSQKLNYNHGAATAQKNLGRYFSRKHNLDSAKYYLENALKLFGDQKNSHQEGLVKYYLINIQMKKGNYNKAIDEIDKNLNYYTKIKKDSALLLRFYKIKAQTYRFLTKYDLGIKNVLKAIDIAENIKDERELLGCYITLGNLYNYIIDDENAIKYYKKALEISLKLNDRAAISTNLSNLGNSYYFTKEYDKSLDHLKRSLAISEELGSNGRIAVTCFIIGRLYVEINKVNKGIAYLQRSLHYSKDIAKNPITQVWAMNGLTTAYIKLNRPSEALEFSGEAIKIADSIGNIDDLYVAYENKMEAYKLTGDYKKAFENHIKYKSVYDSVYNLKKSKEIQRLTTEFETKEKERQIILQEKEIGLLEEKERVSKLQKYLLSSFLLLTLGIVGFGFYGFRQKLRRNKVEKEKVDAELDFKKKELTTHALHLVKKNEVLTSLKSKAEELKAAQNRDGYQHLIRTIDFDLQDDNNWDKFSNYFQQVHKDFNSQIKERYPKISASELRFLSLVKMNLSSKEIASILNISNEGIKKARYRVRKKLGLNASESLEDLIFSI